MRVLVGGSHGLIGSRLVERLTEEGDQVVRLSRLPESEEDVRWDPTRGPIDIRDMELFDAVVHLGGVGIGEKRWTELEKQRLTQSRILSTEKLVEAFGQLINPPATFICASATGFYGDQGDTELTEDSPVGTGFLADLCQKWEAAAVEASQIDGMRVASIRSGVVFSDQGGSLKKQLPLFKLGLGGRLGSGNQWLSWIDIEDEVSAIIHILRNDSLSGPVNLTSPEPLTNDEFTQLMGAVLRRPTIVPAPRWMISLALGAQLTDELLLASARVVPEKLLESGFDFRHPNPAESLVRFFAPENLDLLEEQEVQLGPRPVIDITDNGDDDPNGKNGS